MEREYLLGIDIGTQSARAVIFNRRGGIVRTCSTEYSVSCPRAGWAEQNPEVWWRSTVSNVKSAMEKLNITGKAIAGVGVCGQMHAPVPIGGDGRLLSTSVQLWCDKRSANMVQEFAQREDLEKICKITGNPPVPAWNAFKIKWLKEKEPSLYEQTRKFLAPKDYINYRLTNEVCTDLSDASGTYLMDVGTKRWSREVAENMEIDLGKLPLICDSYTVIGKVSGQAGRQCGLLAGTPVVAGGADMLCSLLGAGVTSQGRACDTTGTASIISFFSDEPVLDPRLMNLHHVIPGWVSFGILDSGGGSLRWFKDEFFHIGKAQAEGTTASHYSIIDREASRAPAGCEGLIFLPYLLGERTLGSAHSRGVLFGLTPRHNKSYVARAIMEGVCFDLRQTLELIQKQGVRVDQIRTIGGGARSQLWSQIKADIYRRPVVTLEAFEEGALGAVILAGVGVGIFQDEKSAVDELVSTSMEYEPDSQNSATYGRLFEVFRGLHDSVRVHFERLAKIDL